MQLVVDTAFKDHTVLSVTHRLGSILSYDKIAVFDKGCLVEFDEPGALLGRKSVFGELYRGNASQ